MDKWIEILDAKNEMNVAVRTDTVKCVIWKNPKTQPNYPAGFWVVPTLVPKQGNASRLDSTVSNVMATDRNISW